MSNNEFEQKNQEKDAKKPYTTPRLEILGLIFEVTQKAGGAEDGGAAMMDKMGQG